MPKQRYDNYEHLNPGLLRHRVTIYRRTVDKSATTGANNTSYTVPLYSNVQAAMNPEEGRKIFDAARFETVYTDTCAMHYQAGIDTTMQLEFDGLRHEIIRVEDVNARHRKLMLALRRLS